MQIMIYYALLMHTCKHFATFVEHKEITVCYSMLCPYDIFSVFI